MTQAPTHHRADDAAPDTSLLFKPDRPRAIDRHIDYFGGATEPGTILDAADSCGESLRERLA